MKTKTEKHKPIPGFPGYRADASGAIWSCWRTRFHAKRVIGTSWRKLKETPVPSGHVKVNIADVNGNRRVVFVHVLMLEAFTGPCPPHMECRHLNDIPTDNRIENLCWGTRRENSEDRRANGIMPMGEDFGSSKIAGRDVLEIRRLVAEGTPQKEIAMQFNIHQSQVSRIARKKRWSHV